MQHIAPQIAQGVCFGKAYAGVSSEKIQRRIFGFWFEIVQIRISRARPRGDFFYPGVI